MHVHARAVLVHGQGNKIFKEISNEKSENNIQLKILTNIMSNMCENSRNSKITQETRKNIK